MILLQNFAFYLTRRKDNVEETKDGVNPLDQKLNKKGAYNNLVREFLFILHKDSTIVFFILGRVPWLIGSFVTSRTGFVTLQYFFRPVWIAILRYNIFSTRHAYKPINENSWEQSNTYTIFRMSGKISFTCNKLCYVGFFTVQCLGYPLQSCIEFWCPLNPFLVSHLPALFTSQTLGHLKE